MRRQSVMRRVKRDAMKAEGKTFTKRVYEAIRLNKPVGAVRFVREGEKA